MRFSVLADAALPEIKALNVEVVQDLGYFSQTGQDLRLDQLVFGTKEGGTFVDVGAHDGVTLSNTYFFERTRGWTGLCIEPNLSVYHQLTMNRTCATSSAAIGSVDGFSEFTVISGYAEMLSGLSDQYSSRHRRRIAREVRRRGGTVSTVKVPTRSLQSLLDEFKIAEIDLLSIDTEGSEALVLSTLDFEATRVRVVIVERNYSSGDVRRLLVDQGFIRVFAVGHDDVYINAAVTGELAEESGSSAV